MSKDQPQDTTEDASNTPLSNDHQQANRHGLAAVDMQEAMAYLDALYELEEIDTDNNNSRWFYARRGLLSAAIVAYCRPFLDNESRGYATARLNLKFEAIRARRALHDLLMEKRHTIIAHADWSARPARIVEAKATCVSWQFPEPNVWEGLDLAEFRLLASGVYGECLTKARKLALMAHGVQLPGWHPDR